MHFEAYIEKVGVMRTASPGQDTLHQLLAMRADGLLLTPEKNPQYGGLGKVKKGCEITKVQHQLNCDVHGPSSITIAVLLANIAKGNQSHMEHLLAAIEGRLYRNCVIAAGQPIDCAALKLTRTEDALDKAGARLVETLSDRLDEALGKLGAHTKNHDCVVLYDQVTIERPDLWAVGQCKKLPNMFGWDGPRMGDPQYTLDLIVKRQA